MNFQKKAPQKVLDILNSKNIEYYWLDYYAFPQTFSSTAGPRNGIGGQAISSFTVEAYVCDGVGPTVYLCEDIYKFVDGEYKGSWYL